MSARGSLLMRATARCTPNHRAMPAIGLDRASRSRARNRPVRSSAPSTSRLRITRCPA